jgi:RNA polymerase sigma-70 factor, ECF subfamily
VTSDAALLAAARTSAGPFRELYDRYADRVLGYHLRRCRDEDAAHELTAETFAQAWLVRARFRDECGGSAGPWLFGIARNVLLASVRRRALEAGARERLGMQARPGTEPDETWLEGLDEALEELPESQRRAIELRVVDDLGYADVAAALGTTPAAARVRVHRGLSALRTRFRPPSSQARTSGDVTKETAR